MPILLIELEAIRRKRLIFESKELEGFTHNLEGFTQSKLLLDIETIRRKESSPSTKAILHFRDFLSFNKEIVGF